MIKTINIVAFDVPYPPNYGGAIDIYYKLLAFNELGWKVILHCFDYGRGRSTVLEKYCQEVHYYSRKRRISAIIDPLPYITKTRINGELLVNLKQNEYPILFEGIHSTGFLDHRDLAHRFKIVRTHNVEQDYYYGLMISETNLFKKIYYYSEVSKLKAYEPRLKYANILAAISDDDVRYYSKSFNTVLSLPAFHGNKLVVSKPGKGDFALYHGNLAVKENEIVALYLVEKIFNHIKFKLIIAGNHPSKRLINAASILPNVKLLSSPDSKRLIDLIQNAHINILPTFQSTGIKLKLLNALYLGRFCLVNSKMLTDSILSQICEVADSDQAMIQEINKLFSRDFATDNIQNRQSVLDKRYSPEKGLMDILGDIQRWYDRNPDIDSLKF